MGKGKWARERVMRYVQEKKEKKKQRRAAFRAAKGMLLPGLPTVPPCLDARDIGNMQRLTAYHSHARLEEGRC
jgi:hypothetical protein